MYPNLSKIKSLHRKYAACEKAFDIVFSHCQVVLMIAEQLIDRKNLKVKLELVKAGALLHDIGAYKFINDNGEFFNQESYIRHGILGEEILRHEDLPEDLCRIASHHTGVGITKEQIIKRNLPLPLNDYLAQTLEERLIMYSDKFHSKTPKFNSFEEYSNYLKQFGEENIYKFRGLADEFGKPDLSSLVFSV